MILDKFKKYMADPSILSEAHIESFKVRTENTPYRIEDTCFNDDYTTLIFDTGWVTFKIEDEDCIVMAYYRDNESKIDKDELWNAFKGMLRDNGCKKITMYTVLNPKMWEERYGFKVKRYEMEAELWPAD